MAANRRVSIVLVTGAIYDLELTPELEENLSKLGQGYQPPSLWFQTHDEEYVNFAHVVSFQFKDTDENIINDDSTGHVYDASDEETPWRPKQTGSVITSEPDMVTRARELGEDVGDA